MNAIWVGLGLLSGLVVAVAMSLLGDEVKGWIGRVPYAILWVASRRVPPSHRAVLHGEWVADLAGALQDRSERPITRLLVGTRFAIGLVSGGRQVAIELGPVRANGNTTDQLTPANTDAAFPYQSAIDNARHWFVDYYAKTYGITLVPVTQQPEDRATTVYRTAAGDLVELTTDGACGSTYWEVVVRLVDREWPVRTIGGRITNATGHIEILESFPSLKP